MNYTLCSLVESINQNMVELEVNIRLVVYYYFERDFVVLLLGVVWELAAKTFFLLLSDFCVFVFLSSFFNVLTSLSGCCRLSEMLRSKTPY